MNARTALVFPTSDLSVHEMTGNRFEFVDHGSLVQQESFAEHVREGLSADQKTLSPKFFYDERGSELFKEITQLPEYYPYESELALLRKHAEEIVSSISDQGTLIELGSGSAVKTRILLEAALDVREEVHYVPVDISGEFLRNCSRDLVEDYSSLSVTAVAGTYEVALKHLPELEEPRLFLFMGGNIGNYPPEEARRLLSEIAAEMKSGDHLLVGIDLLKDPEVIERAYNDDRGVTATFNKNILTRINRELEGEFKPIQFRHEASFVPEKERVEMHLVSKREQSVPIHSLDQTVHFEEGETIHTENSHKFNRESFQELCENTGLEIDKMLRDNRDYFAEVMLSAK